MTSRDAKKTERLEVRLAPDTKVAFGDACERQGDTPSGAVRRFIDGYVRRADRDAASEGFRALRAMARRNLIPIAAVSTAAAASLVFIVWPRNEPAPGTIPAALFTAYDANDDGRLAPGEIAADDADLHRVLDIDGSGAIEKDEFYAEGDMNWGFIEPGSLAMSENEDGPVANFPPPRDATRVTFDLSDPERPALSVWQAKEAAESRYSTNRTVLYEEGKALPALVFNSYEYSPKRRSA